MHTASAGRTPVESLTTPPLVRRYLTEWQNHVVKLMQALTNHDTREFLKKKPLSLLFPSPFCLPLDPFLFLFFVFVDISFPLLSRVLLQGRPTPLNLSNLSLFFYSSSSANVLRLEAPRTTFSSLMRNSTAHDRRCPFSGVLGRRCPYPYLHLPHAQSVFPHLHEKIHLLYRPLPRLLLHQ